MRKWRPSARSREFRGTIAATDGSFRGPLGNGSAFLDDAGDWWLAWVAHDDQSPSRHASMHAELRAIRHAVTKHPHKITVLTDCRDAAELVNAWQMGLPKQIWGYRGKTLEGFANRVRTEPGLVDVRWVAGHQGHPLNEGADALARLASRAIRDDLSMEFVRSQGAEIAAAFAASFRAKVADWERTVGLAA